MTPEEQIARLIDEVQGQRREIERLRGLLAQSREETGAAHRAASAARGEATRERERNDRMQREREALVQRVLRLPNDPPTAEQMEIARRAAFGD